MVFLHSVWIKVKEMKIFNTRAPLRLKGLVLRVVYIYIWCRGPFVYIKERVSSFRYKGTVCETNLCTAFMTMTCNVLNYSQSSMILLSTYIYIEMQYDVRLFISLVKT